MTAKGIASAGLRIYFDSATSTTASELRLLGAF